VFLLPLIVVLVYRINVFITDATIHVTAYAAAFLFAVLVGAVSPFGFSWPYKQ